MATNPVDVFTADGHYLRALGHFGEPVIVSVTQPRADALAVSVIGSAGDTERALSSVRRMLGTERDLSDFRRHVRAMPWLAPLARRMRGLKPHGIPHCSRHAPTRSCFSKSVCSRRARSCAA